MILSACLIGIGGKSNSAKNPVLACPVRFARRRVIKGQTGDSHPRAGLTREPLFDIIIYIIINNY